MAWHGKFNPQNPQKYAGDPKGIVYRSSLEFKMMRRFDSSPHVVLWSSEEFIVPYYDPVKKKARRYFPDFVIKYVGADGTEQVQMIEVKPYKETIKPSHKPGKQRRRILNEELTWANNQAKWAAAEEYCSSKGWKFVKITEKEIGRTY